MFNLVSFGGQHQGETLVCEQSNINIPVLPELNMEVHEEWSYMLCESMNSVPSLDESTKQICVRGSVYCNKCHKHILYVVG